MPEQPTSLCAICQSPLLPEEETVDCSGCSAEYHAECWSENQGCATYGCPQVPPTEGRSSLEVPVAYWGQEYKPCPVCSQQILAAAVRCRHCGTTFQTARPVDSAEYSKAAALTAQSPRVRRIIVWLFVACLIPCTAPIGVIATWFWQQSHREEIESLPSIYPALIKMGLIVGLAQSIGLVILSLIFTLVRH